MPAGGGAALPSHRPHSPEAPPLPHARCLVRARETLAVIMGHHVLWGPGCRDRESQHPVQHLSRGPGLMALIIQGDRRGGGLHRGWSLLLMRPQSTPAPPLAPTPLLITLPPPPDPLMAQSCLGCRDRVSSSGARLFCSGVGQGPLVSVCSLDPSPCGPRPCIRRRTTSGSWWTWV